MVIIMHLWVNMMREIGPKVLCSISTTTPEIFIKAHSLKIVKEMAFVLASMARIILLKLVGLLMIAAMATIKSLMQII